MSRIGIIRQYGPLKRGNSIDWSYMKENSRFQEKAIIIYDFAFILHGTEHFTDIPREAGKLIADHFKEEFNKRNIFLRSGRQTDNLPGKYDLALIGAVVIATNDMGPVFSAEIEIISIDKRNAVFLAKHSREGMFCMIKMKKTVVEISMEMEDYIR